MEYAVVLLVVWFAATVVRDVFGTLRQALFRFVVRVGVAAVKVVNILRGLKFDLSKEKVAYYLHAISASARLAANMIAMNPTMYYVEPPKEEKPEAEHHARPRKKQPRQAVHHDDADADDDDHGQELPL
ncbi:hypothetical protein [Ottowia sp.]|uniref:hypothetical protein n=1 Tax=Ottowia sp. TaxID=1898956 RepID=UPI0025DCB2B1|nr:hypothetical protein [Ottowia sp.]MBK6616530.1 hypothetical protein [Ottowia sp.]